MGVSWEILRASGSTREGVQIRLGSLLGLVCLLLAAEGGLGKVLGSFLARFIPSRSLLGSILSSQTHLPTLKNVDFRKAGARFLKNHHFPFKDGFESALWLSWAPFGGSLGLFRASGSTTGGFQIPLRFLLGLG